MSGWSNEDRVRASDKVLSQVLDGEAVLLDLGSGTYFGLNEVGTVVWSCINPPGASEEAVRLDTIVEKIVADYEVNEQQACKDLFELLDELLSKGIVVKVPDDQ